MYVYLSIHTIHKEVLWVILLYNKFTTLLLLSHVQKGNINKRFLCLSVTFTLKTKCSNKSTFNLDQRIKYYISVSQKCLHGQCTGKDDISYLCDY